MDSGIYFIRNSFNNKIYIGSSVSIGRRIKRHIWGLNKGVHENEHLQKSFIKHGSNSLEFGTVELIHESELIPREQYWIDYYDSSNIDKGYNIVPFADRHKLSEQTKLKMSISQKGRPHPPLSEEHKEKLRQCHLGKPSPMKGIKRGHPWNYGIKTGIVTKGSFKSGHKLSDIARIKKSQSLMGHSVSEETRRKISEAQIGKKCSEETKKKLSIINKGKVAYVMTDEIRKKISTSLLGHPYFKKGYNYENIIR